MKGDERRKVKGSGTGKDGKILTITTLYHAPDDRRRTVAADGYVGMRPRDKAERPVGKGHVVQQEANRQRAVVGVRVELDVLMPVHLIMTVIPFEVEL